jgi:DNA-binding response OmpR family regulator
MSTPRVLIVDDEPDLREILAEELQDQGFEVMQASSGSEAWDLLKTIRFEIVVSDIRMPHGDGLTLLKNIRSGTLEKPPIVFLLSGFSDLNESEAQEIGARNIFAKPFQLRTITTALKEALKDD